MTSPPLADAATDAPLNARAEPTTLDAIRSRGRFRSRLLLLGPAFVAAIAYVDPGNFATNSAAGAGYGYELLWVIVVANLMAMLIQNLSAKLGVATGRNLCELSREHFPRFLTYGLWLQAELVAMATDLAEVIGGAVALNLLFGLPLFYGGIVTGCVAFGLLALHSRGYRQFERAIAGLFAVILIGFAVNVVRVSIDPGPAARGLVPHFSSSDSLLLAIGILGATVMPHVIYLHSALTQRRIVVRGRAQRRQLLRSTRIDVLLAMTAAGLVNITMLVVAAALFYHSPIADTDTLEGIHAGLGHALDRPAALAFAVALLASGLASSGVGTYAGQVVMQGYLRRNIPLLLRRALTLAPALIVLAFGVDPTRVLVLSQVVLSFGIPFALIPLILLTRRPDVMGELVNRSGTTALAGLIAAVIIALNVALLFHTFA
jgi:manganese transport protein